MAFACVLYQKIDGAGLGASEMVNTNELKGSKTP